MTKEGNVKMVHDNLVKIQEGQDNLYNETHQPAREGKDWNSWVQNVNKEKQNWDQSEKTLGAQEDQHKNLDQNLKKSCYL